MLYAYVIRHKDRDQTMYDSYKASMEKFALEQLEQGRVNDDLSVIYEEFIREDMINEQIASALPSILLPEKSGAVIRGSPVWLSATGNCSRRRRQHLLRERQ